MHPGGWGLLGLSFAGYVPASKNPYPIIVYSVANYRLSGKCHCDFKNGIQCEPTVKYFQNTTAGTIS